MSGFYDIFSTQISKKENHSNPVDGLEHEDKIILNDYIDDLYSLDTLNIYPGLEDDGGPFDDIVPDAEDAAIQPDNSNDPMSMDNNTLGDNSPFDGLVDESGENMGDMFSDNPDDQSEEQKHTNDQIVVDREKLLRSAYNLGDNIRKIFPNRFIQLREIIQSNLNSMELLELSNNEDQDLLRKIILLYEEQIKNIDIFLDIIADQTFDVIFRKYVEIFTNCSKLKDAYNLLIKEDKPKSNKRNKKYS